MSKKKEKVVTKDELKRLPSKIKKTDFSWINTKEYLIIHFKDRPCQVKKGTDKHKRVESLIKRGRNKELADFLFPSKEGVQRYTDGVFRVKEDGSVWIKGTKEQVHESIAKYLIQFYRKKLPYIALVKFWENLSKNPSQESKDQLYLFLRANNMPITPDGFFLAYKKVDKKKGRLWDNYTGNICNDIGKIVKMPRDKVDPDRYQTCSNGLHVAAWNYAQGYSGDVLIEVKVNPANVVAVPNDYNNEKMRVCEYQCWSLSKSRIESEYIAPDALKLMRDESKKAMTKERRVVGKGEDVLIENKTAREIIELVQEKTGFEIKVSLKNKQKIIKTANQLLKKHKVKKSVSLKNKTAKEIIEKVEEETGEKIELNLKNKKGILNRAMTVLKLFGFRPRKS